MVRIGLILVFSLTASLTDAQRPDVDEARMDLMRHRAMSIRFSGDKEGFPERLNTEPLFRYDDVPRGYVDGTVWRLGKVGRPLAIITTELHPKYLGSSPRVVYDFLSLSETPFRANSNDVAWRPPRSAVEMKTLRIDTRPAGSSVRRLSQMKQVIQRFTANQIVSEESAEEKQLSLRLLPRPIDRYQPAKSKNSDGATFLFVAGRMPGVIVFLETDGMKWQYGVGRLSAPSTLLVAFDGERVWAVPPNNGTWSDPYNASNSPAKIPGFN